MAKPTPTTHCNKCGVDLNTVKRYGGRCMSCYSTHIVQKRKKLKERAVEYKGGKCSDCGREYPVAVFDFHHDDEDRNNNKDKTIGHMTHSCRPWKVIQEELDNCTLLCANCHRMRHF